MASIVLYHYQADMCLQKTAYIYNSSLKPIG